MDFSNAFAMMGQAAAPATGGGADGGFMPILIMMGMIFAVFYFLVARPQNKERKRQQEVRDAVKSGDKVITIGGVHGKVTGVDMTNDTVAVKVDTNTTIHFSKGAIATVILKEEHER